jgi:hypothetical protein
VPIFSRSEFPRVRSGFRQRAQTPAKRLNFARGWDTKLGDTFAPASTISAFFTDLVIPSGTRISRSEVRAQSRDLLLETAACPTLRFLREGWKTLQLNTQNYPKNITCTYVPSLTLKARYQPTWSGSS